MARHVFQKGNKFSVGRRQNGQGNPSNKVKAERKLAAAHALKYLEDHYLKRGFDAFGMLATGGGPRGGKLPKWLKDVDRQANKEFVGKFVPDAPRRIDLGLLESMEDFAGQVMSGEIYKDMDEEEAELVQPAIEDKTEEGGE